MNTSASSFLSPEAKEFMPLLSFPPPPTIPVYIDGNTLSSLYPPERQPQQLIYPLIKIPEIELRLPSSNNDNVSQIVLLPTPGCYPGAPMSNFSPIHYPEQSFINYSFPQSKPNRTSTARPQRGFNHPTNSKQTSRGTHARSTTQRKENFAQKNYPANGNESAFKLRVEDFPSLPVHDQKLEKIPDPLPKPVLPWNTVVATSRPHSASPSRTARPNRSPSSTINPPKPPPPTEQQQQRSQSLTSNEGPIEEPDGFVQTKQQQKRTRRKKNKNKEQPTPSLPSTSPVPESTPFSLEDENAFPSLGQEVSISLPKKSETAKENVSTPGVINKSKIKANHGYQIRLTDMFNALSTSTQTKAQNSHPKTNKIPINSANPLDSNPAPKRGKEREEPKPRKPTKLKRIINKELEDNQKQRQQLLTKLSAIKQPDESTIIQSDESTINLLRESTSASCTEESDEDEILDHEPTSQLQTPYSQQVPHSNIQQQIHDAGFREYCAQLIDRQLDELCIQLLLTLKRFQDRKKQQFQSNPERARRKRRFVHGIREVTKHLRLQRLKCVLIAPDCQSIHSEGGLNDALEQIITLCKEQSIPYIFTLNRQKLGRCLNRISRISTIGIFDCSGADQIYKQIVEITDENQRAYTQIVDNILNHEETLTTPSHGLNSREFYKILHRTFQQQQQRSHIVNTIPSESLSKVLPKVPAHFAHSRQTSDTSTIYIDPQLINSIKKQHIRASSGTFEMDGKSTTKKQHQRTLSDGATAIDEMSLQIKHHPKTHSRTPSGCSAISHIEQQDYFEQSKSILLMNNNEELDNDENRLKSIHEDTEENSANIKRKNVEKWINDN